MSMSLENIQRKMEGIAAAIDEINKKKIIVPFESEAAAKIDEIQTKLNALIETEALIKVNADEVTIAKAKAEELLSKLLKIQNIGVIKVRIETEGL